MIALFSRNIVGPTDCPGSEAKNPSSQAVFPLEGKPKAKGLRKIFSKYAPVSLLILLLKISH